jgi:hypothetical protein
MPSWGEVQEYARTNYKLAEDGESFFSLVFAYESGRSQKIFIRKFTAFDKEWIEFRSAVCKEAELPHRVALRKNDDIACGALALDNDGDYVLLYSVPLPSMDLEEFELPLHVISSYADKLERDYSTGNDDF